MQERLQGLLLLGVGVCICENGISGLMCGSCMEPYWGVVQPVWLVGLWGVSLRQQVFMVISSARREGQSEQAGGAGLCSRQSSESMYIFGES